MQIGLRHYLHHCYMLENPQDRGLKVKFLEGYTETKGVQLGSARGLKVEVRGRNFAKEGSAEFQCGLGSGAGKGWRRQQWRRVKVAGRLEPE